MEAVPFTEKSYWLSTRPYQPGPALAGDLEADVAIIGAGYTGLTSAYFLKEAEPGLRVALLEADVVGSGASGRNGGFSMTKIGMMHSITALRFGKARAVEAHEYAERAVDLVHRMVQELGFDCDYEHPGYLWVATSEKQRRRLYKEIELVHRLGIKGISLIDSHELRQRVNSPLYVGGAWWEPNCGILNPAKLAWCWRDAVAQRGVEIYEGTPVQTVEQTAEGSRLTTPNGRVRAGKVVFAANAWSHQFAPLKAKQVPAWTYIVMTEPLNDQQRAALRWRGREGVEDFRDLVHYYRLTADDRLVWGGRDVALSPDGGMDHDRNEAVFAALRGDLYRTFPALEGIHFTHAWGGPVSAALDLFPAIGHAGNPDWVYVLGCVGHGVSLTHLHGQTVRDLVLERDTDLTRSFFVDRRMVPVPPGPLRRLVTGAMVGFMRWEDRRYDVMPDHR
ncbi:MAG: FAD-dependent oxidoreductase [Acidimicrobiia bacterium]|nr:FAD-dependent oxidoreductase [Acidimicrobiia bacterium]